MSDPIAVARIWLAVDRLTKPEHRRIDDSTHGTVPSLWDQSTVALTGSEHDSTGPGGDPAERQPCDLDLMEVRGIIRDTTTLELRRLQARHRLARKLPAEVPARIRRFAAWVIDWEPAELWWYEYRFASWARLLATFLGEIDRANRERWLRNSPCPKCGIGQVLIDADTRRVLAPGDRAERRVWVPALLQDFRDGHLRGIACQACGDYTFAGEQLYELRAALGVVVALT